MDPILEGFIREQHEKGAELSAGSDRIDITPMPPAHGGSVPQAFVVSIDAMGLVREESGAIVEFPRCDVGVLFPDDYLSRRHFRIPLAAQVLTYLGPHPRPWHCNLRPPHICISIRPGSPLVEVALALWEVWTWQRWAAEDPMNDAAAQWARNQPRERFPVDRRPLRRRALNLQIEVVSS